MADSAAADLAAGSSRWESASGTVSSFQRDTFDPHDIENKFERNDRRLLRHLQGLRADVGNRRAAESEEPETDDMWAKGFSGLGEHVTARNTTGEKILTELKASRMAVKDEYQASMVLLKELELERIDLQMSVQRLASMRQNWKTRYVSQRLTSSPDVEQRLVEEERAAMEEVAILDQNIREISIQVSKLRESRDTIDRRLSEKRQHLFLEGQIMETCKKLMERPHTSRPIPRRQLTTKSLYGASGGATPRNRSKTAPWT